MIVEESLSYAHIESQNSEDLQFQVEKLLEEILREVQQGGIKCLEMFNSFGKKEGSIKNEKKSNSSWSCMSEIEH
jgi:hypothetical protein